MKSTFRSSILQLCLLAFTTSTDIEDVSVKTTMSAIELNYGVNVFECDNNLEELESDNRQAKRQGRTVRICLQPNDVAKEAGVTIKKVDSWIWETAHDGGIAKQVAATDGQGDGLLSEMKCNDEGTLCVLDTLLSSDFFKNKGSVAGHGEASLSDGTGRVPISKDIFQVKFNFIMKDGISGENITDEETQEIIRILQEQEEAASATIEGGIASTSDQPIDEL